MEIAADRWLANQLLAPAHSSLQALADTSAGLKIGEAVATDPGASVHIKIDVGSQDVAHKAVVGYISGSGSFTGPTKGQGMDRQVILVSANYDGLGVGLHGSLYAGASGVATLLELARALKGGAYQPKKTGRQYPYSAIGMAPIKMRTPPRTTLTPSIRKS
jgi:Zn-dependent M28 family amino/carboxypeptidase